MNFKKFCFEQIQYSGFDWITKEDFCVLNLPSARPATRGRQWGNCPHRNFQKNLKAPKPFSVVRWNNEWQSFFSPENISWLRPYRQPHINFCSSRIVLKLLKRLNAFSPFALLCYPFYVQSFGQSVLSNFFLSVTSTHIFAQQPPRLQNGFFHLKKNELKDKFSRILVLTEGITDYHHFLLLITLTLWK